MGSIPGLGRSLEATHSSILAWRIPWTEELGGLQSIGLQRVGHESGANTNTMDHGDSEIENARFVFSKCELSGISSLDLYTS